MNKCKRVFIRQGLLPTFLLFVLALAPISQAADFDKSDLNNDGMVDTLDLEIFSTEFFGQDWETVDWCNFYESSILNEKYFRRIVSDKLAHYKILLDFIAATYDCQATAPTADKSDLNNDGIVDQADLLIFSTNYLQTNWELVDWCVFHGSTLAGAEFEGRSTKYFLQHFTQLLSFINDHYNCGGVEPPPNALALENTPSGIYRLTAAPSAIGGYYVTDPRIGSLFIYDVFMVPQGEIKGLNKPLGVAVNAQGHILVGNDGRDNIEIYDPTTGDLLGIFGEGAVKMPNAITFDLAGNIYVTDSRKHNIKVFDPAYNLIKTIGRAGEGEDELYFPIDAEIIVSSSGGTANAQELFVADNGNFRVQVFDLDGKWLRSITFGGTSGTNCSWMTGICEIPGVAPFTRVQSLDTDSLGRLHVVDAFAATVSMFDPVTGDYLGSYGGYGEGPGFLLVPKDVLITGADLSIVIAGDGSRIEFFSAP